MSKTGFASYLKMKNLINLFWNTKKHVLHVKKPVFPNFEI